MTQKEALLLSLAECGYNTGVCAKRHFKSYDILRIGPRYISVVTIFVGIIQMTETYKVFSKTNVLYAEFLSTILIIIGILGLMTDCISNNTNRDKFNAAGITIMGLFNELRNMYNQVKAMDEDAGETDCASYYSRIKEIEKTTSETALSEQILFSGVLSHIGFFGGEVQIDWMDEQLHFGLTDKVPFTVLVILAAGIIFVLYKVFANLWR